MQGRLSSVLAGRGWFAFEASQGAALAGLDPEKASASSDSRLSFPRHQKAGMGKAPWVWPAVLQEPGQEQAPSRLGAGYVATFLILPLCPLVSRLLSLGARLEGHLADPDSA